MVALMLGLSLSVTGTASAEQLPIDRLSCGHDTGWKDLGIKFNGYTTQYRYTGYWQDYSGTGHMHFYKIRTKKWWWWIEQPEPVSKVCGTGAGPQHPRSTSMPY